MVEELDVQEFDTMLAVNVAAPFYACQAVWPVMRQRGGGVIVNISSMAAIDPFPGFAAYGAMKSYVDALTRNLAKEGHEHGIRVYAVGPGAVDTQMLRGPFPDFPVEQCLRPEEVAEVVWTVAQPVCRYSAGQTIYLSKT
jgi:NAD(P)-dependent dehydrogenase (short-subunit alcohol dehydrogenase family)